MQLQVFQMLVLFVNSQAYHPRMRQMTDRVVPDASS